MTINHSNRCRFDYFNDKSAPLCKNWDTFFHSCKVLEYSTKLEGKRQAIHPIVSSEQLWLIEQVGCGSFKPIPTKEKKV